MSSKNSENAALNGITREQADQIIKELEMLRKMRLFELLERGVSQAQIANMLGISQPTVSRMAPKISLKKTGKSHD